VPRSSDCQTVASTRRVVGSCWLCGAHRTRAAAVACENRGNPDRGTPSSAIHTTSDALHVFCAIHTISSFDGAVLDTNVMARNVCRDLVFEASSHDACSHSDLGGYADGTAEALPARQTASIRWHAPMQLSGLPRVFVHTLAFSSTPSHDNAAEFSSTPSQCHCSCMVSVCSTQTAASHHSPRVGNCLTVAAQRHGEAAPYRAFMGIK